MRHIFIINPVAGNGRFQNDIVNAIHAELKDKEIEYEIYISKFKGDIQNYLNNKCRDHVSSVIYACGGDGTLHDVIEAACSFKHVSVGVIPCGSGNDFIKNFENPDNFNKIEAQIQGESIELDLIKVNDKFAASVCNIGLDADAASNMHKFKKIPFISGTSRYFLSVFYCLVHKLGKALEVTVDNKIKLNGVYLLGVVANGHSYGGGYKCAPLAVINDGILDLCFVENMSRLKIINIIGSYKEGKHLENPKISRYITYNKCSHVLIKSNEPINVCIDGESFIYDEVELSVARNSLKFWQPKGTQVQDAITQCLRPKRAKTLVNETAGIQNEETIV